MARIMRPATLLLARFLPGSLALLAWLLLTGLLLVLIGHSSISFVEPFNARQRAASMFVSVPS
ncbi:MAG: hypothetical protein V4477_06790 [Pseudomonadota bacterium]